MAYEPRGGTVHYYAKVRNGEKVESVHLRGTIAELYDALVRRDRERLAQRIETRQPVEDTIYLTKRFTDCIKHIRTAVLYRSGWHCHQGHWRECREPVRPVKSPLHAPAPTAPQDPDRFLETMHHLGGVLKKLQSGVQNQEDVDWLFEMDLAVLVDRALELGCICYSACRSRGVLDQSAEETPLIPVDDTGRFGRAINLIVNGIPDEGWGWDPPIPLLTRFAMTQEAVCLIDVFSLGYLQEARPVLYTTAQWEKRLRPASSRLERAEAFLRDVQAGEKRHVVALGKAFAEIERLQNESWLRAIY